MPNSPNGFGRLLDLLFLCSKEIGILKTRKVLQGEIKKNQSLTNSDALFIVSAISEELNISEQEIYNGTGRKNDRRYAIGFCAYYLHYVYHYDMQEVQFMLRQKNEWVIYKYSLVIKELNPKHTSDQRYIDIKKSLDIRMSQRRGKKKQKNEKAYRATAIAGK